MCPGKRDLKPGALRRHDEGSSPERRRLGDPRGPELASGKGAEVTARR